jgi:hypothetical protein
VIAGIEGQSVIFTVSEGAVLFFGLYTSRTLQSVDTGAEGQIARAGGVAQDEGFFGAANHHVSKADDGVTLRVRTDPLAVGGGGEVREDVDDLGLGAFDGVAGADGDLRDLLESG